MRPWASGDPLFIALWSDDLETCFDGIAAISYSSVWMKSSVVRSWESGGR